MATLVLNVNGKDEAFERIPTKWVDTVEKLVMDKVKKGVDMKKIRADVDKKFALTEEEEHVQDLEAARIAGTKDDPSAQGPRAQKKGSGKNAKAPAAADAPKRGKGENNEKRTKAGEIINSMREAGHDNAKILAALQNELSITYPNAYYYLTRVFNK